ncbi:DUF1524 domain-containing protein [Rhodococcus hoagii]|nr:DUF1524 domain-containing protein [Prescottella equi]NKR23516.1 DUF1524 domain-containing protein [Prescottella equi]NKT56330.1 DUF1524 domain-containing protein [Prescottella equi]NKU37509.1 DUF1524 domain-containing protein [Prescottella equi]NKZ80606.1 DUF1524 domain-containing protein [Prescottella equi]
MLAPTHRSAPILSNQPGARAHLDPIPRPQGRLHGRPTRPATRPPRQCHTPPREDLPVTTRTRSAIATLLIAGSALGATACNDAFASSGSLAAPAPAPAPAAAPSDGTAAANALATLGALPVKGRAPKTGYTRDQFGQAWSDDVTVDGGHNGCDTRNDILARDLTSTTFKDGKKRCVVLTGTLADPYTATTIEFVRGEKTSTAVQIDHVVALSDAWQKGAQQLDPATRRNLANDPRNLYAVDGPTNSQKGDGDAATWLPPNKGFRCTYVTRQIEVKADYHLWVTEAERDAMTRVLQQC